MIRWLGMAMGFFIAGISAQALAATTSGKVATAMVVLIPQQQTMAVYEQIALASPEQHPMIGILPGARSLQAVNATVVSHAAEYAVVDPAGQKFVLRYRIPWNGRSGSLMMPAFESIEGLIFLTPHSLTVPAVLNPSLRHAGQGRLPGVPHSPVFDEYTTSDVVQGESVPLVIEAAATRASAVSTLFQGSGNDPVMASLFQGLIVLVGLGAALAAIHWKPAQYPDRRHKVREQRLQELAILDACHRRGEISDAEHQAQRKELMAALTQGWDEKAHV